MEYIRNLQGNTTHMGSWAQAGPKRPGPFAAAPGPGPWAQAHGPMGPRDATSFRTDG